MIKRQLKLLLDFTKKEFEGILVFLILLLLVVFAPDIYQWLNPRRVYDLDKFKREIADFKVSAGKEKVYTSGPVRSANETVNAKPEYFKFNPNDLPVKSWERLGLSDKQIHVIKNYEAKGGRFYKKEDLQKIYSISPELYRRLEPYIVIPENTFSRKKRAEPGKKEHAASKPRLVELNSADSLQLLSVKGIGPVFALRILKYRDRLGGFYDKRQLLEVYGLDSMRYEQLKGQVKVDSMLISKIRINTATFDDLKKIPYLSYKQINAIVQYRKQHGLYRKAGDLRNIVILTQETINKIRPYLSFK